MGSHRAETFLSSLPRNRSEYGRRLVLISELVPWVDLSGSVVHRRRPQCCCCDRGTSPSRFVPIAHLKKPISSTCNGYQQQNNDKLNELHIDCEWLGDSTSLLWFDEAKVKHEIEEHYEITN
jgi:hypothetical protein